MAGTPADGNAARWAKPICASFDEGTANLSVRWLWTTRRLYRMTSPPSRHAQGD